MSKLIAITGITGVQGSSVADVYLKTPGWRVRGVTRNPSSAAAKEWEAKGVEIVPGDLNNTESLAEAFQGADAIFGVTDFWTSFKDPASQTKKKADQNILQYCFEVERQQGINLADAAATVPNLSRFVLSSMADANKWSKGKFNELYHMDSKAQAADYAKSLPALKSKFSQVQAPIYYNLLWEWGLPTTPKRQADGTYRIQGVGPADAPIPFGDVRKDFGYLVKAAVEGEPDLNIFAVGEELSWNQYLKTWCESQNVPFGGYDEVAYDDFTVILPGGLGHEFGQNVLFAIEFGYDGSDPSVTRPDAYGIKMTTFKEYCEVTDFSAIL
ncbi:putative -like family protein [Phaeoacremonium minimum UCRPA7]|uniref:Putative-like family protein n=1 Tax=Phaeoacremonium minimum (strain UCR-PA7) TaxID=1286976 RepID=R8BSQ2_PHAM7|nr:putative -like family protein [Phaeoacremonium minimum UCRPA7]EOO02418.1 putative -like family protein [Phaeoacremonium minimum UCRPA7]